MEAVQEEVLAAPPRTVRPEGDPGGRMDTLTVVKLTPSLVRFAGDAMVYFGSDYNVWCEAEDFRRDTESEASLSLETGDSVLALCTILPDPQRRGVRRGTLSLANVSEQDGRYWLCARLAGNVVFRAEVSVFAVAPSGQGAGVAQG